jgi:hypothetical protein
VFSSVTPIEKVMEGNTPTLVVSVLAGVFFLLAVKLYFVRLEDAEIEPLSFFSIAFAMGVSGASLASEGILLAVLFSSPAYTALGAVVLAGRLLHVPVGAKIALSLYGFWGSGGASGAALAKKVSAQLVLKSMWYSVVSLFGLVELPLLRFLPWLRSDFTLHSQGYPDIQMTRLCTFVKLANSITTFSCSAYFLHLINSNQHVQASYILYFDISLAIQCVMLLQSAQETVMRSSVLAQMQLGESSRRSSFKFPTSTSVDENPFAPSLRGSTVDAIKPTRRLSLTRQVIQQNAPVPLVVETNNPILAVIDEEGAGL